MVMRVGWQAKKNRQQCCLSVPCDFPLSVTEGGGWMWRAIPCSRQGSHISDMAATMLVEPRSAGNAKGTRVGTPLVKESPLSSLSLSPKTSNNPGGGRMLIQWLPGQFLFFAILCLRQTYLRFRSSDRQTNIDVLRRFRCPVLTNARRGLYRKGGAQVKKEKKKSFQGP